MKYEKEKIWRMEGGYIETCNCDVVCPCLINSIGNNKAPATYTHCDLFLGYQIKKGHFKDVDLSGLNIVLAFYSPGYLMEIRNWKGAYYFDERATKEQYNALMEMFMEDNGGQPQALKEMCQEILGVRRAKIEIDMQERYCSIKVDDIAKARVDAIASIPEGELVKVTNIHPQCIDVVQGVNTDMSWRDYGFTFENTGRSGLWGEFIWQDNYANGLKPGN